jgi:hypothetical protein
VEARTATGKPVTGEQKPEVGKEDCLVGEISGTTCGRIAALNWGSGNFGFVGECGKKMEPPAACLAGTTIATSVGGDSGGPWFPKGNEGLVEGINRGRGEEVECRNTGENKAGQYRFASEAECAAYAGAGEGEWERFYVPPNGVVPTFEPLKQPVAGAPKGALDAMNLVLLTTANENRGECVLVKKGDYKDATCEEEDLKKGKPTGKYEFEAEGSCYPKKDGRFGNPACTELKEKKGKPKGKYEVAG